MDYLTSVQTAEKWGISSTRITIMANAGRIPGAVRIGSRWMIPADAEKPIDGRTKAAQSSAAVEDSFRYPAFEGRDAAAILPPLCAEELQLKGAMEEFYACRFAEAARLLGDLPERTQNRYRRINALRLASVCSFLLCDRERFLDSFGKLTTEMQQDFPRKREMQELVHELDAMLGDSSYFSGEFHIEPGYSYHESYLPHLAALCTISLFYAGNKEVSRETLMSYEFICASYDGTPNYLDSQTMHLYLGCTYAVLGIEADMTRHLRRALELAAQHELFYGVATEYFYMEKAFEPALSGFSAEFRATLRQCSEDIHRRYLKFTDAMSINSIFKLLLHREFIYVVYAAQGYQNKEVAKLLHASEQTVKRKYSEIYDSLGVKTKRELVELYRLAVKGTEDK